MPRPRKEKADDSIQHQSLKLKRGRSLANPYVSKRVESNMLSAPYPVSVGNGEVDSREFVLEKLEQTFVQPLAFATEEDWLSFAKELWPYRQRKEEIAMREKVASLVAQAKADPKLLQRLLQDLTAPPSVEEAAPLHPAVTLTSDISELDIATMFA